MSEPLLRVRGLSKYFPVTRGVFSRVSGYVRAVDDVSFELNAGETLGLVGESGCGKSTVGRTLLRLHAPTAGDVWFEGRNLAQLSTEDLQRTRRNMQIVFQDPYSSLNPRQRVFDIVGEALAVHGLYRGDALRARVLELLAQVGVSARWADRYAHEFSGGQRQRIGIARAIALEPKLLVCDEAVSALDVSIQAQIINLLIELREQLGLAYVFISHDLSVVRHVSHRVLVMYLGQVVELGPTRELFETPAHPYTRALLSAVPVPDPRRQPQRVILHGDVPSPLNPPSGCRFHTRCPVAFERCPTEMPALYRLGERGRTARCFHAEGLEGEPDWYDKLVARFESAAHRQSHGLNEAASLVDARQTPESSSARGEESGVRRRRDVGHSAASIVDAGQAVPVVGDSGHSESAGTTALGSAPPSRRDADSVDPEPEFGWRRRVALLLSASLVALLALSTVRGVERNAQVRRELRALHDEARGQRQTTGSYPASLSEFGYRLGFVFGRGLGNDPWGNAYHYEIDEVARRLEIVSSGPDGEFGNADDVAVSEPLISESN